MNDREVEFMDAVAEVADEICVDELEFEKHDRDDAIYYTGSFDVADFPEAELPPKAHIMVANEYNAAILKAYKELEDRPEESWFAFLEKYLGREYDDALLDKFDGMIWCPINATISVSFRPSLGNQYMIDVEASLDCESDESGEQIYDLSIACDPARGRWQSALRSALLDIAETLKPNKTFRRTASSIRTPSKDGRIAARISRQFLNSSSNPI